MRWDARSLPGLVRSKNEDSWLVKRISDDPEVWFLAVADGMGGFEGGEYASRLAVQTCFQHVVRAVSETENGQSLHQDVHADPAARYAAVLEEGVRKANRVVFEEAMNLFGYPGMGTTLTAALVRGPDLWVCHVGDSRAYLVSSGTIRQVSEDHSVVGELVRSGALSEEEAMHHPQRHILTLALGTQADVPVSCYREKLAPGDAVVLCTDGLTTLVSSSEILEALGSKRRSEVANFLANLANSRGGYDNITLVVFWVDEGEGPEVSPR